MPDQERTAPPLEYSSIPPAPRPLWELLSLAAPTVAQMASYTVMQFTDTYMLSRVGNLEATAAGQSGMLAFTIISLGFGVMLVVNTLVSQSAGRGDNRACGQFLWQGIWTGLLFGLLALPLLPAAGPIFSLMDHEPVLAALEVDFFQITVAFSAVKLASMAAGQFLLAVQRPNVVLVSAIFGVATTIAVNSVLIYGNLGFPAMGVRGAAWATNAGVTVELVVLLLFVRTPSVASLYHTGDWRLRWDKLRTLLAVGIPSGVQIVAEVFAWTLFSVWVIGRFDADMMAANNYTFRYMSVSFMPAFGISQAVTALVGRYIGQGRPDVAMSRAHLGFKVTAAYMLVCGILFFAFRRHLIGLFTNDPDVLRAGAALLVFAAIYQFFDAAYIVYNGALRGAGDTFVPAIVTAGLCWGITVGGGYLMATRVPQWGVVGPWAAASAYGVILSAYLFARFTRGRWRTIRLGKARAEEPGSGSHVILPPGRLATQPVDQA